MFSLHFCTFLVVFIIADHLPSHPGWSLLVLSPLKAAGHYLPPALISAAWEMATGGDAAPRCLLTASRCPTSSFCWENKSKHAWGMSAAGEPTNILQPHCSFSPPPTCLLAYGNTMSCFLFFFLGSCTSVCRGSVVTVCGSGQKHQSGFFYEWKKA